GAQVAREGVQVGQRRPAVGIHVRPAAERIVVNTLARRAQVVEENARTHRTVHEAPGFESLAAQLTTAARVTALPGSRVRRGARSGIHGNNLKMAIRLGSQPADLAHTGVCGREALRRRKMPGASADGHSPQNNPSFDPDKEMAQAWNARFLQIEAISQGRRT